MVFTVPVSVAAVDDVFDGLFLVFLVNRPGFGGDLQEAQGASYHWQRVAQRVGERCGQGAIGYSGPHSEPHPCERKVYASGEM